MIFIEVTCVDGNKKLINISSIDYIEDKGIIVNGKRVSVIESYEEIKNKLNEQERKRLFS